MIRKCSDLAHDVYHMTKSLSSRHVTRDVTEPLFLLAAFTMATPTVFYLVIDHENKPIGRIFEVILEKNIIQLKKKVKEETPNALKDVDASHLVVWRCKGEQVFDEVGGKLELQVRAVLNKKEVTELDGRQKINELELSDSEVLLIQVPSPCPLFPEIPLFSADPLSYQCTTSPIPRSGRSKWKTLSLSVSSSMEVTNQICLMLRSLIITVFSSRT
jgi:hypothetical protein